MIPTGFALDIPVDPDAPDARRMLLDELSKPGYAEAQPTLLDRVSKAIGDWLASLFSGGGEAPLGLAPAIIVTVVVLVVVAAFLIWGMPRLNRRGASADTVFSVDDARDAAQIRADAARAAQAGDYDLALTDGFRALARGLAERTIVAVSPGTTAHEVAALAATAFPAFGARLGATARAFDGVRYLGERGTAADYDAVARLDADLQAATPVGFDGAGFDGAGIESSGGTGTPGTPAGSVSEMAGPR